MNNILALRTAVTGGPRVRTGMSVREHAALAESRELIGQGRLRIVIDRGYPLAEIVDAHRHVDSGHKVGNVVITVVNDGVTTDGTRAATSSWDGAVKVWDPAHPLGFAVGTVHGGVFAYRLSTDRS